MNRILDFKNEEIRIIHKGQGKSKLAILYPGYAYSLDAPIFFYLIEILGKAGYDIIGINYRYSENAKYMESTEIIQDEWFDFDSNSIGDSIKNEAEKYDKRIFIGKSLGTTMLMKQLRNGKISEDARLIWLTPGTYLKEVCSSIIDYKNMSLMICGTGDKFYDKYEIDRLKSRDNVIVEEIKNAGHVFEQEDDIYQSIDNLKIVIKAISSFI